MIQGSQDAVARRLTWGTCERKKLPAPNAHPASVALAVLSPEDLTNRNMPTLAHDKCSRTEYERANGTGKR